MNIYSNWSHPVKIRKGSSQYSFTNPTNVVSDLTTNKQYYCGGSIYNGKYYFLDLNVLKTYDLSTTQVETITTTGDSLHFRTYYTSFLYPVPVFKSDDEMCLFLVGGSCLLDINHTIITKINLVTLVVTNYISTVGPYYAIAEISLEDGLIYSFGKVGTSTSYVFNINSEEFSLIPDLPINLIGGTCALNSTTSEIIFIGGIKESPFEFPAEVLSYNTSTQQYSTKTNKPHLPMLYLKNGIRINNDIIVVGGNTNKICKFSLTTNEYIEIGNIHESRYDCFQFLYNDKIYYTDGSNTQDYCCDMWSGNLAITCS